ncbi:hypothetical protein EDD86DRAFT_249622 [Gorgonomyces haynaldii]|nr:hypothetical protein EDD86DRAFT_249622 [Gorgonomyces haynaldii]
MISDCVSFGANKLQIQPFGCTNGPPQSIDDFIRFGILLFLVGSLVGAMMMGTIADSIGRKRSFFIGSFLAVIAGVGQTFTTSVSWFYGYQFLMGSFAGFLSVLGAVYLTEIVKPDGRGGLVSWLYIMLCEGISVSFFVQSTVLPPHRGTVMEYQLTIATQSVISGIILVSAFLLEESPRWLALRGHSQRGLFAHAKLMGYSKQEVDPEVCERYQEIQKSCSGQMMETTPNFVELFSKEYVQVTSLCIKVALMQAFTGAPLFAFFMLRQVPFLTQFQNGIYLNFANVGAVCLGMVLIDKLGRRPIVVIGSVLMAISYAFVMIDQIPRTFSVFFYVICFSGTWGHLPWTYLPEVLPARIRAQAFGLATAVGWTVFMILFILAPTLFDMFDRWVFLGTGSLCLLIAVYSHFVVQETKQLHLEEITLSFPKMNGFQSNVKQTLQLLHPHEQQTLDKLDQLQSRFTALDQFDPLDNPYLVRIKYSLSEYLQEYCMRIYSLVFKRLEPLLHLDHDKSILNQLHELESMQVEPALSVFKKILSDCKQVWFKRLFSWILDAQSTDFMIHDFKLLEEQQPWFVTDKQALDLLYIGKAVYALKTKQDLREYQESVLESFDPEQFDQSLLETKEKISQLLYQTVKDGGMIQVFEMFRDIFLLGQGDFADHLLEQLIQLKIEHGAQQLMVTKYELSNAFVKTSQLLQDKPYYDKLNSVHLSFSQEPSVYGSWIFARTLQFELLIDWPMDLYVSQEHMKLYNQLFSFLSCVKLVLSRLIDLIDPLYQQLLSNLKLDTIQDTHLVFLQQLMQGCFMNDPKLKPIYDSIMQLLFSVDQACTILSQEYPNQELLETKTKVSDLTEGV